MKAISGSYVGNGVVDTEINIGYQPDLVIINGVCFRTSSNPTNSTSMLASDIPNQGNCIKSFTANGFTVGTSGNVNTNGTTYYYFAAQISGATDFAVGSYTGDGINNHAITSLGFAPTALVIKGNSSHYAWWRTSNIAGDSTMPFAAFQNQSNRIKSLDAGGFTLGTETEINESGVTFYWFAFGNNSSIYKAASFTGNGSDDRDIGSVGFQPILVWVKANSDNTAVVRLGSMVGDTSTPFGTSTPTTNLIQSIGVDGFQVGTGVAVNESGKSIQYFAAGAGFTRVTKTFTAQASALNTTKRFTAQARANGHITKSFTAQARVFPKSKGPLADLQYRSVDLMKWIKDTTQNQPADASITNITEFCQENLNLTHLGIAAAIDPTAFFPSGYAPSSRTLPVFYKAWTDAVHNVGLRVLHRALSFAMEGTSPFTGKWGGNRYPAGSKTDIILTPITDDFSRSSIGSSYQLGNPGDTGNVWSISGGALLGPASNGWRRSLLTTSTYTNFTAVAKVKKVGNQQLIGRGATDPNSPGYGFQLRTGEFRLERPGLQQLATASKTFVEGSFYYIKITLSGNHIQGKVWLVGNSEPGTWDIDVTDSTYSSGSIGFSGEDSFGVFDDLTINTEANYNSWLGIVYQYIINNPGLFMNGDIWAPFPERTENIFSDSTAFLPSTGAGLSANYASFFNDVVDVSAYAFSQIGVEGVLVGYSANNYSEVRSGFIPQSFFTKARVVSVDYYQNYNGDGYTGPVLHTDLQTVASSKGFPVFLQEWGTTPDMITATGTTNSVLRESTFIRPVYDALVTEFNAGRLQGFNYWGFWDTGDTDSGIAKITGSTTTKSNIKLRREGWILAEYFNQGPQPTRWFTARARNRVGAQPVTFTAKARVPKGATFTAKAKSVFFTNSQVSFTSKASVVSSVPAPSTTWSKESSYPGSWTRH